MQRKDTISQRDAVLQREKGWNLTASWREGRRSEKGFLDDYAYSIAALLELYHATLEEEYLKKAEQFCQETVKRFADPENGGFFFCEAGEEELFFNPKETYDGAVPSGNSVMAYNLVRLSQLTGQEVYETLARQQLSFLDDQAEEYPAGHSLFLLAKLLEENPPEHVTAVVERRRGEETGGSERIKKEGMQREEIQKEKAQKEKEQPGVLEKENTEDKQQKAEIVRFARAELPLLANVRVVEESVEYPLLNQRTTYYICKDFHCLPPRN